MAKTHRAGRHLPTSMLQNWGFATDLGQHHRHQTQRMQHGLPAGAAALFNRKFCQSSSSSSTKNNSSLPLLANSSSGSDKHKDEVKQKAVDEVLKPSEAAHFGGDVANGTKDRKNETVHPANSRMALRQAPVSTAPKADTKPKIDSNAFSRNFLNNWDSSEYPSMKASLNNAGFKRMAALNSTEQMKMYVRRVAQSCNLKVINDGGLNGAVEWFNSTPGFHSFSRLKLSLFKALIAPSKHHWVTAKKDPRITGRNAPLDLVGYVQVRALRNMKHMQTFVRRMIRSMGLKIVNEDGFNGMMRFYEEPDSSNGFEKLMFDIKKAAYEHTWTELE